MLRWSSTIIQIIRLRKENKHLTLVSLARVHDIAMPVESDLRENVKYRLIKRNFLLEREYNQLEQLRERRLAKWRLRVRGASRIAQAWLETPVVVTADACPVGGRNPPPARDSNRHMESLRGVSVDERHTPDPITLVLSISMRSPYRFTDSSPAAYAPIL